jgi:hypothetical protein
MKRSTLTASTLAALFAIVLLGPGHALAQAESLPASPLATQKHGVAYYLLDEGNSVYSITGYDSSNRPLLSLQWAGGPGSERVEFKASQGGITVQMSCLTATGQCSLLENGVAVPTERLSKGAQQVLATANDYFADVLGNLVPACGVRDFSALNERQRRIANGTCFIAGICTGFWPIGTLICGPTAAGCAVMYFSGAL